MSDETRRYLALGDSMSIDDYTGVAGGGAVRRFFETLEGAWQLVDETFDGARIADVPRDRRGDLITLTIGGNDLLAARERWLREGLDAFAHEHAALLEALRDANPEAVLVVGTIYAPESPLAGEERAALDAANEAIRVNAAAVGGRVAEIREAFAGREAELLCLEIEPNLEGAGVIAECFREAIR